MMAAMAATAMSLGELLGSMPAAISQTTITDLVSDSRQVQPGAAFVAICLFGFMFTLYPREFAHPFAAEINL